jgi:hypothetical protein
MLEIDPLDKLIESRVPAQPVVIVQYRTRGVSLWLFVLFVLVVMLTALYVYH